MTVIDKAGAGVVDGLQRRQPEFRQNLIHHFRRRRGERALQIALGAGGHRGADVGQKPGVNRDHLRGGKPGEMRRAGDERPAANGFNGGFLAAGEFADGVINGGLGARAVGFRLFALFLAGAVFRQRGLDVDPLRQQLRLDRIHPRHPSGEYFRGVARLAVTETGAGFFIRGEERLRDHPGVPVAGRQMRVAPNRQRPRGFRADVAIPVDEHGQVHPVRRFRDAACERFPRDDHFRGGHLAVAERVHVAGLVQDHFKRAPIVRRQHRLRLGAHLIPPAHAGQGGIVAKLVDGRHLWAEALSMKFQTGRRN